MQILLCLQRMFHGLSRIRPVLSREMVAVTVMTVLVQPDALFGQWERLPLYAGHAERLIQNKFKPNEIFAVVARGGIYKSEDYGETWRTLVTDIARLRWDYIWDFEVSASGRYYAFVRSYSVYSIWCSSNDGVSWAADKSLSVDLAWPFTLEAHQDSTVMIFTGFTTYCIQSKDDFVHIDTIRFDQLGNSVWDINCHPDTASILFLLNIRAAASVPHSIEHTTDRGNTWSTFMFNDPGLIVDLNKSQAESSNHLGLWLKYYIYQYDALHCDYYESSDNGVTWSHADKASIIQYVSDGEPYTQAWYDIRGINFLSLNNILYRSADCNTTVSPVEGISIWNMLSVNETLLASTTMDGLQVSTDLGLTWQPARNSRSFAGFNSIEVAAANTDTMFAIVSDEPFNNPRGTDKRFIDELLQSFDGGMSWSTAVRDTTLMFLRASDALQACFHAVRNENVLVRGTPSTGSIDTLYASIGSIIQYEFSETYTTDIYLVERNEDHIAVYYSTNSGVSWYTSFAVPAFTQVLEVIPSRVERGTFMVICYTNDSRVSGGMGLWLVRQYGQSQTLVVPTYNCLIDRYMLFGEDVLYNKGTIEFSSDYGGTWLKNVVGLDSTDESRIHLYDGSSDFTYYDKLYVPCGDKWYCYTNSAWRTVCDRSGANVSRTSPSAVGVGRYSRSASAMRVGDCLYSGNAFDGLYRIRINDITPVEPPQHDATRILLECYPNPFSNHVQIRYRVPGTGMRSTTLLIRDELGREVFRRTMTDKEGYVAWNGRDAYGRTLESGIYFIVLQQSDRVLSHTILIHVR